jgi:hypothetical protein
MNSEQQIFWTFFITTVCGFLLALGRQMYKSKCKEIECCCLRIVRDVQGEEKYDEMQLQSVGNREDIESTSLENIHVGTPRKV